jgi:signal transduction histidine kinase
MSQEEPLLKAAFDSLPEGLLLWSAEGRLALANRRFLEMYGLARDEVEGLVGPALETKLKQSGKLPLRRSRALPGVGRLEFFEESPGETRAARREQILGIAIHDLRSPLANVRSYAALLLGGQIPSLDARIRRSAETIVRNADRALKLLQAYFDTVRAETGRLDVDRQPVALPNLLQEVVGSRRAAAAEKGVEIALEMPPSLPILPLDRERVSSSLTAFLENALARSGPTGKVVVKCEERPAEIWVGFADEGPALSQEARSEVFDRDAQVLKEQRLGIGFSMAVARAVAEAHGGTTGVIASVERTIFFMTLSR